MFITDTLSAGPRHDVVIYANLCTIVGIFVAGTLQQTEYSPQ